MEPMLQSVNDFLSWTTVSLVVSVYTTTAYMLNKVLGVELK